MSQQQMFPKYQLGNGYVKLEKPKWASTPRKEEMVEIPILGTIDSATGKITYYGKKKKKT